MERRRQSAGAKRRLGSLVGLRAGAGQGAQYKYSIVAADGRTRFDKADPLAFATELPPGTASKVWDLSRHAWGDGEWMTHRAARQSLTAPIAIYEVHLGSWMRIPEQGNRPLNYRELAPKLADHVYEMGFTHVEMMPVFEHPSLKSWGYQVTSYYAPSSRLGTPQDLMFLVNALHQRGIGVILDWVPAHFAPDAHGLGGFDGTHLYEPAQASRQKFPIWNTYAFNYESPPVVNFLVANAWFWLDKYHFDGLRVDGVEAMIRLGFSRQAGEWRPNKFGGDENLEAIAFLERLNRKVHERFPAILTFAEDATARPHITRPVQFGGLGFDLKWDLGWTYDTLHHYMVLDLAKRKEAHSKLTFRMHYGFNENYLLPLSHDEVVPGKQSLLARMPGDEWQKRANLRLLYGYMYTLPGKKLLFMGDEIGQWQEWSHNTSIDWHLLNDPRHAGLRRWVRDLNTIYRAEPCATRARLPGGRVHLARSRQRRAKRALLLSQGDGRRRHRAGDLQLLFQRLSELPSRRPRARPLGRSPQQRRQNVRRQRTGQHGRPDDRADWLARACTVAQPDRAAPGRPRPQAFPALNGRLPRDDQAFAAAVGAPDDSCTSSR